MEQGNSLLGWGGCLSGDWVRRLSVGDWVRLSIWWLGEEVVCLVPCRMLSCILVCIHSPTLTKIGSPFSSSLLTRVLKFGQFSCPAYFQIRRSRTSLHINPWKFCQNADCDSIDLRQGWGSLLPLLSFIGNLPLGVEFISISKTYNFLSKLTKIIELHTYIKQ